MSSTFTGLSTALNSLMAQRRALDVTGQNIANAGTVGYTRQRAELQAVTTNGNGGLYSGAQAPGYGVEVASVSRLAEMLVDARQRDAHSTSSYALARQNALQRVENIVNEPSDDGLSAQLSQLWTSWQSVANAPGGTTAGLAARTQLLSQASDLAGNVRAARTSVSDAFDDGRRQLVSLVDTVNATASGIADLNDKIRVATAADTTVNELVDQRDGLVLQLSGLVGATSRTRPDGTADVVMGGSTLVTGGSTVRLQLTGGLAMDDVAATPVTLAWADGTPTATSGGQVGGLLAAVNTTYPAAAAGYDALAAKLIGSVNALHRNGTSLSNTTGVDFFAGTDARDLRVALTNPSDVAAASPEDVAAAGPPVNGVPPVVLGNGMADQISQLRIAADGPDAVWASHVATVGVEAQSVNRQVAIQSSVLRQANDNRASASGVSIDEEMTNMLMYQRAYEGAAKVMTVVDEMLETLINIGR